MKLYASAAQPNYTGPLLGGAFYSKDGVVEIRDDAEDAKQLLAFYHAFSTEKPKAASVAKEAPKEPVAK